MTLFLPVHLASPPLYWQLEEVMFSWMLSIVSCWSWSAGYSIVESGESLDNVRNINNNKKQITANILFTVAEQETVGVTKPPEHC